VDGRERKEKKARKKHANRRKTDAEKIAEIERRQAAAGKLKRAARTTHWIIDQQSGFYVDTHGDADNLAFEGLYRVNIAAYHRYDPTAFAKGTRPRQGFAYGPR
jgi:hypothetical protein